MIAQTAAVLPPVAVTAGATWLLHKRAGMPFWQALMSVLLGLAFGPDGPGDQLAAFAAQATRRIAAETARRRAPQQDRRQACGAVARAVLAVAAAGAARGAALIVPGAAVSVFSRLPWRWQGWLTLALTGGIIPPVTTPGDRIAGEPLNPACRLAAGDPAR